MSSPSLAPAGSSTWQWLKAACLMAKPAFQRWPASPAGPEFMAPCWTAQPKVATRTPPPAPHSVPAARSFALRTMERWGVTDRRYDVAAVVSELMTNALRHSLAEAEPDSGCHDGVDADLADLARTPWLPIRLGLLHPGPCVLCAVADPSTQVPVTRRPAPMEETGRGLQLVESLSDQWGFCPAPDGRGKVVWAAFATVPRRPGGRF